jgi:hypothetical protein
MSIHYILCMSIYLILFLSIIYNIYLSISIIYLEFLILLPNSLPMAGGYLFLDTYLTIYLELSLSLQDTWPVAGRLTSWPSIYLFTWSSHSHYQNPSLCQDAFPKSTYLSIYIEPLLSLPDSLPVAGRLLLAIYLSI